MKLKDIILHDFNGILYIVYYVDFNIMILYHTIIYNIIQLKCMEVNQHSFNNI